MFNLTRNEHNANDNTRYLYNTMNKFNENLHVQFTRLN